MSIGHRIKQSLSNWGRIQEILRIFAKYGFANLIREMGLSSDQSGDEATHAKSMPWQLRKAFEELGPTFIKLGQIMSTRPDLLPPEYIAEFSKLRDDVPPFSFIEVETIIEEEFGRSLGEIYESFETTPIAAASVSQVHRAKLQEPEAGLLEVVVKVQRPHITEKIQADIQILYFLARTLKKVRKDFRLFNLTGIVREFQKSISEELDFGLEAKNIEEIGRNSQENEVVVFPQVVWSSSSKRVLTMSELKGQVLSQVKEYPVSIDRPYLADSLAEFFLESIFFHGHFHCDAHPGNLILIEEGRGKIGLVDFGMVGRLSPDLRDKMSRIFLALVSQDFTSLASLYTEVATFNRRFSLKEFRLDLERLLEPNLNKPLSQVDVGAMMLDSIQIARKYEVKLPRDLILFYRAVVTLEFLGRSIDPEFTFLKFGTRFSKKLIQRKLSTENVMRDLFRFVEGLRSLSTDIPSQLKIILNRLETDGGLDRYSEGIQAFKRTNKILALSIILFGLIIGASIISSFQPQHFAVLPLWIAAGFSFLLLLTQIFRK
ncbi:MAG: hypothetical protein COV44_03675 [Deltaproteobacteria bacterium CG11_big_fil_rev_8_21_14_0_20_45_16]|nr:MAG: hypothetical protein COV44_03675 [Deltaproteobacteria bacterium CG11_big_fil_rev_8_21_14_0_20_45_16]